MTRNVGVGGFNIKEGLFPTAFTGIREWQVMDLDEPMLRSVYWPYEWTNGVNDARCMSGPHYNRDCWDRHPAGARYRHTDDCTPEPCELLTKECGSGFWAYTTAEESWSRHLQPWGYTFTVRGAVLGWGRVRIGPKGFRCLKAVVAGLVVPVREDFPGSWSEERSAKTLASVPRVMAALAEQFPRVLFFDSVEEMVGVFPLTDLAPLLEGAGRAGCS